MHNLDNIIQNGYVGMKFISSRLVNIIPCCKPGYLCICGCDGDDHRVYAAKLLVFDAGFDTSELYLIGCCYYQGWKGI